MNWQDLVLEGIVDDEMLRDAAQAARCRRRMRLVGHDAPIPAAAPRLLVEQFYTGGEYPPSADARRRPRAA
ncbi:MAG: hypothetical protein U0531_06105 [Dehalococcoidia bacterium]